MRSLPLLVVLTTMLTACAGGSRITENQCAAGDWQTLGYRDGTNGFSSAHLLTHQDTCVKYGIVPERQQYMLGWNQGVREYCEPSNAFTVGERGQRYDNVCPSDLRGDFLAAYQDGRSRYLVRSEINSLDRQLSANLARIEQIKKDIIATATAQLNAELTIAERATLLAETQSLNDEKHYLQNMIIQLDSELIAKQQELESLERSLHTAYVN